ncbi:MAG: molecular chaperone TorD family protein, partial [bacterium]
ELMAELDQAYAELGFAAGHSTHQTPDHASVELEFMSVLCEREAGAWSAEDSGEGVRCLKLQKQFLENHLLRWIPIFSAGVREKQGESLYTRAAGAIESFISHETDLIGSLLNRYERAAGP